MEFRRPRAASTLVFAFVAVLAAAGALAQTEFQAEQRDLPPVAAPTNKVSVTPIPTVRSESEAAGDFSTGLIQGLVASGAVHDAALVAVRDDHVIVSQAFGPGFASRSTLEANVFVPVLAGIGSPQQSGQDAGAVNAILMAVGASESRFDGANFLTTPGDASKLLLALADAGMIGGVQAVEPQSFERMFRVEPAPHPILPGHTESFAEMRRSGWSALVRDEESDRTQSRLVVVPDAKLAYLISFTGRPGASVWRAADDALFDKMLPAHGPSDVAAEAGAAPTLAQAQRVAGTYEPEPSRLSFLKTAARLRVSARDDGSLVLSGADESVLMPRPGGYWSSDDGNQNAVADDGGLLLSTGAYRPLAFWKRPLMYALLALLGALSTAGAAIRQRRSATAIPHDLVLWTGGLTTALLFLSLLVWHLAPGA
jgi:hypothetical protein